MAPLGSLAASKVSLTHQDHSRSIIGLQFGTGARTALVKGPLSASRALQQVGYPILIHLPEGTRTFYPSFRSYNFVGENTRPEEIEEISEKLLGYGAIIDHDRGKKHDTSNFKQPHLLVRNASVQEQSAAGTWSHSSATYTNKHLGVKCLSVNLLGDLRTKMFHQPPIYGRKLMSGHNLI